MRAGALLTTQGAAGSALSLWLDLVAVFWGGPAAKASRTQAAAEVWTTVQKVKE